MATLYRQYRPQTFQDLVGQKHIKITLQHELELSQIGHAYLFTGPRGLGKTTSARLFAKSVNCQNRKPRESEPCNQCDSCQAIMANRAVDVIEIDAASHTGVDKVRENIIENIRFLPNQSKYKVFIIDEVHMLSISAFNALLKTLEEPPEHAIFILCTTEIHKVPQTIISRCQRFDFKRVSREEIIGRLQYLAKQESKKVDEKVLSRIAAYSEGCLRDAESLLGKIFSLGDDISLEQAEIVLPQSNLDQVMDFLSYLSEANALAAIELLNQLVEDGGDLNLFVDSTIEVLRKILLIKIDEHLADLSVDLTADNLSAVKILSQKFSYDKLVFIIELLLEKRQEMKSAFIVQFPLEVAVVQIVEDLKGSDNNDIDSDSSDNSNSGSKFFKKSLKSKITKFTEDGKNDHKSQPIKLSHLDQKKAKIDEVKVDLLSQASKKQTKIKIDFKKIKTNWPDIIRELLKENFTLASLLRLSQPLRTYDNILEIGLKNSFYKSRLENEKNKQLLERVISEVLKNEVQIVGLVKEDIEPIEMDLFDLTSDEEQANQPSQHIQPSQPKPKDAVQDVMNMF